MENWRSYLRNANGDIFEIINKAIMMAASDYPIEFQDNKEKIAEILYSCALIKCSGCAKCKRDVVREEEADESSKIKNHIKPPQIIPTSTKQQRTNVVRIKLKKAQDKTDGATTSSLYRKWIAEILRIKGILDNSQGESESVVCELLTKLQYMGLCLDVLEATGIGKSVNVLQKHASKEVNQIAKTLMKQWKGMVDERFENKSSVVKPTYGEQVKPTSLNTEKKFQTDSEKANNIKGRQTPDQRQSKLMDSKEVLIQHKLEPTKRKLEINLEKPKNTKASLTPDQHRKPMDSKVATKNQKGENSIDEEKFEATKRKLQHNYEEAENTKKKRKIHVIELHELSKHGLLPQQRQLKSRNEQFKRRGNVHSRIHRLVSTF